MFELSAEQPKTVFTITKDGKIKFADGLSKDEATTQAAQLLAEKFSALHQAQAARIATLKRLVEILIENDPDDMAADAVTVLDVWRKEARAALGGKDE